MHEKEELEPEENISRKTSLQGSSFSYVEVSKYESTGQVLIMK